MSIIVKIMVVLDFGFDIRDRMWFKIIIFNVFIGKVIIVFYDCFSSFVLKCIL